MNYIADIFSNKILQTAVISWLIAQTIKVAISLIKTRQVDFTRFMGSGGMPSSHAAFTTSLATATGLQTGFQNPLFAVTAAFSFVVMYDATGVRRSAGEQAKILNRIVKSTEHGDTKETGKKLKELLGHTPLEVFAGAVLGVLIAAII